MPGSTRMFASGRRHPTDSHDYPEQIGIYNQESFAEALNYIHASGRGGKNIVVTKFNMAYIYVLFYTGYPPDRFVRTVVYDDPGAEFRQVQSFGRYRFMDFGAPVAPQADTFYLVENDKAGNLPGDQAKAIRRFKRFTVLEY